MLWALLSIFAFPLSLWAILNFMETGNQVNRARNQSKLDAVGLSLCHQMRGYLESKNHIWNRRIRLHQIKMSTQAATCLAQASLLSLKGGPAAFHARMRLCNSQLQIQSLESLRLEKLQALQLTRFLLSLNGKRKELLQMNSLEDRIKIEIPRPTSAYRGLKRAPLPSSENFFEKLIASYGPKRSWPRKWVAQEFIFTQIFQIKSYLFSKAWVFQAQQALTESRIQTPPIQSSCWIKELKPGEKYEVHRK